MENELYFNNLNTIVFQLIDNNNPWHPLLKIIDFLKFTSLFRKLDKDDNRNGEAKLEWGEKT